MTGLTTRNAGWVLGAYTYTLDSLGQRIKAEEYVSDLSFVDYLPLITNNYSGTVEGQSALYGGDDSTFVSPLPLPEDAALGALNSPLPTPVSIPETTSLLDGPSQSVANTSAFPNALATTFLSPLSPPASCPGGLPTFGATEIITYTYDPLSRLTDAFYSSGACFRYNYDAGNNVTWSEESITSTRIITYAYDVISRLQTSKVDVETTTWYYRFDNNGNLKEMTPNGASPANGAIRYTYSAANQLNKIETHNGSAYVTLAQMAYDGIGSRVVLTGWVSGVAYTTTYASRIAGTVQILQATNGANTTSYLYGLDQIGEFGLQSVYYLTDGAGSIRHLVDPNGAVKLARMYEPFGQVLMQTGTGDPTYGYLGAQFDRISGLLYINGRYYDPITGRFLTPGDNEQNNPYVPLGGAALAPILILALIGRKRKGKIWTGWVVIALMMSAGLMVVGCDTSNPQNENKPKPQKTVAPLQKYTPEPPVKNQTETPAAPPKVPLPSPTATCTPTPNSTAMPGSDAFESLAQQLGEVFFAEGNAYVPPVAPEVWYAMGYTLRAQVNDVDGSLDENLYQYMSATIIPGRTGWRSGLIASPEQIQAAREVIRGSIPNPVPGAEGWLAGSQWPKRDTEGKCIFKDSYGLFVPDKDVIRRLDAEGRFVGKYEQQGAEDFGLLGTYFVANASTNWQYLLDQPESLSFCPNDRTAWHHIP